MPESRMVTLSDGPGWGLAPAAVLSVPRGAAARAPRARRAGWSWGGSSEPSRYMSQLADHVAAACEGPEEAAQASEAYARLASLTLSRKLSDESYIGQGERAALLRAARMPDYLYANPATEAVFASSADHLGKGNVFKDIGKAVNRAVTGVNKAASGIGKAINRGLIPATRSLQSVGDISQGLMNDLKRATSGVGKNVADFASSPQGTGAILGALTGDPGLGPIGAGAPGAAGYDASGQPLPAGTQYQPQTLLYAGVAVVALIFVLSSGGRRR